MAHLIDKSKLQNFVHHVDTSFTKEVISTTVEYYPGTGVTYTPTSGASKVIYECNLQTGWNPDNNANYPNTRLQYSTDSTNYIDGNWTTISGTQMLEGNNSVESDYLWHNFMWLFVIDSWSGERKIRLAGRSKGSSEEFTIGRSYNAVPSSGEGDGSCPHVTIYSVMP